MKNGKMLPTQGDYEQAKKYFFLCFASVVIIISIVISFLIAILIVEEPVELAKKFPALILIIPLIVAIYFGYNFRKQMHIYKTYVLKDEKHRNKLEKNFYWKKLVLLWDKTYLENNQENPL